MGKSSEVLLKNRVKVMVWILTQDSQPSILLLKTLQTRGGFWQPVTGWVDEGESPLQAAIREAKEESGIDLTHSIFPLNYRFSFQNRHDKKWVDEEVFYGLLDRVPEKTVLDPKEHDQYQWIPISDKEQILLLLDHKEVQNAFLRLLLLKG